MEINRVIGGKAYTIELDDDEIYQAYLEKNRELTIYKVLQYLDSVEEVGGIPSELLQSERFADKAVAQLSQMEGFYTENITNAVQMAIDYEIKSNTLEDIVTASTADVIIAKLNSANYRFQGDSAVLTNTLKNQPNSVIKSLRQGAAAESCTAGQQKCISSCIGTVDKFKAFTNVSRGINEREDYDDNDYAKPLRKEREATGYYQYQESQDNTDDILDLTNSNSNSRKR